MPQPRHSWRGCGIRPSNGSRRKNPALAIRTLEKAGARRYWAIWATAIPLALWALVRAFGLEGGERLTALMWFTPYAAIAAMLVAGVAVALRNWAAAATAAIATACLGAAVLPRAVGSETVSAAGHETLTVLSANVYRGAADPVALVAIVDRYDPDILSVQELTPAFASQLRRAGIDRRLPHSVRETEPKGRGGGFYARYPLQRLPVRDPSPTRMPRATVALPDGGRLRVVAVHPLPPNTGADRWRDTLRRLPGAGVGAPWLLIGDFNATLDQAEFRHLVDRGYRDAGDATGKGLEPTWPGPDEFSWGLIAIDHVLVDRRLGIADYGVSDLPDSDHRSIHAQLVLP
jgi:endonuclease/exonuclease/phosphatase family metal-dependent hydrolase